MLAPKVARYFSRIDSTNVALLQAIEQDTALPEGTVFVTDHQTAGKGQGNNRWHSTPGANLTLSLLLRPDHLSVDRLFALTQVASIALHEAVNPHLPVHLQSQLRIKWPNDLYAGSKKLAGILIQNGLRGSSVQWSVIGIGLNVNEDRFPADLGTKATSLRILLGREVDRSEILEELFTSFQKWNTLLEGDRYDDLGLAYHQQLYQRGQQVSFMDLKDQQSFTAVVRGVNRQGHLEVILKDGSISRYELRSLRWLA